MYESHFGLKKRPFRALALGNDVFIGPQTAATMAGIKKALTTPDAIVAVAGPVGGGKTAVVGRALDGVGRNRVSIPVGRIKLGHDEVLELLLEELGVENLPAGTVQRFAMFRRILKDLADKGTRAIVVVEDAVRIGADALSELEALTAADAGVSEGANVILMGDENIDALLDNPALARLKQRLRLRQALAPFNAKELLGYFKHCFRLAGGDFDSLFVPEAAGLIHQLSNGIPRMANNLAESAMTLAAEAGLDRVTADHINAVAAEEFGMTPAVVPAPAVAEPPARPIAGEARESRADDAAAAPAQPDPRQSEPAQPDPRQAEPAEAEPAAEETDVEIPELIQDTLPDLEILAPELVKPARPEAEEPVAVPAEAAAEPPAPAAADPEPADDDDIPTLSAAEPAADEPDIPAWDRDPTLAELKPDLDALEHAMALAHGRDAEPEPAPPPVTPKPAAARAPAGAGEAAPEVVPEITLDREIQAKIEEAAEAIKRTEEAAAAKAAADAEAEKQIDIAATGEIAVELPMPKSESPKPAPKPEPAEAAAEPEDDAANDTHGDTEELQRIAKNLSQARTIDDVVDDRMAETLFGDEFSEIAAQVAARAKQELPANDELELVADDDAAEAAPVPDFEGAAAVRVKPTAAARGPRPQLDKAAEQRLATVRALNGTAGTTPPMPPSAETIVMGESNRAPQPPAGNGESPDSIEDQINTSITQTLKTLSARPPSDDDGADDDKKGFFSRFRKS